MKRGLPAVLSSDTDLIIGVFEINLSEQSGVIKIIQNLINQRQRIVILNYYLIQILIINAKLKLTILLRNEEHKYNTLTLRLLYLFLR